MSSCEKPIVIGPLLVGETVTASFDLRRQTASPSNPSVDIVHYSGTADATPSAMRVGAAQVSGTEVLQRITGLVDGATYLLTAWADAPDGNRHASRQALLTVCASTAT